MNPFTIEDSSMSLDKLGLDCVFLEEKDIPNRTRSSGDISIWVRVQTPATTPKACFFKKRLFRRVFVEIVGLEPVFGFAEKL